MTSAPPVVGVDGGGSRIRVAVADRAGRMLMRREKVTDAADPALPEGRAAELAALVGETLRSAQTGGPAAALVVGLAGAGDPLAHARILEELEAHRLADRVEVVSDGEIALEGAFGGGSGIVLVAGTGSVAFGRRGNGEVLRCGGWGTVAGDEGSGYDLGRTALRALLRAHDGRGPETVLAEAVLARIGITDARGIPGWAARAPKREIAALATEVIAAAEVGDPVAEVLVDAVVDALVEHLEALLRRLGSGEVLPTALRGGLATAGAVRRRIERRIAAAGVAVRLVEGRGDALSGAVEMAISAGRAPRDLSGG